MKFTISDSSELLVGPAFKFTRLSEFPQKGLAFDLVISIVCHPVSIFHIVRLRCGPCYHPPPRHSWHAPYPHIHSEADIDGMIALISTEEVWCSCVHHFLGQTGPNQPDPLVHPPTERGPF
jgi:hypothetical protein